MKSVKFKRREVLITSVACSLAILLTGLLSQYFVVAALPVLIASMGASAVILFVMPSSPVAQPWSFCGGHLCSALVGIIASYLITERVMAATVAVFVSVLLMQLLRCLHPPGAATALAPVLHSAHTAWPDFSFLLMPVGCNVLIMLLLAFTLNKWLLKHRYPANNTPLSSMVKAANLVGVTANDYAEAISGVKHFVDIGTDDINQIFRGLQLLAYQRHSQLLTCADIMQRKIVTASYDMPVVVAWQLMQEQRLTVLPVLDTRQRVIGIITQYDFMKNVQMTPYQSFQARWQAFLKPSADVTTTKPEYIGHIMTKNVKTLLETTHIAELMPLIVNEGHHHIPIVNAELRLVGVVFQSKVLTVLFNQAIQPE